jgi:hypothetical protein
MAHHSATAAIADSGGVDSGDVDSGDVDSDGA